MKRFAIALVVLLLVLIAAGYNVWRANQEPVTAAPSQLEIGRQQLHGQIEAAAKTEEQIEKQEWDSPVLLEGIVKAHEQRIERLKENKQAGEIIEHDRAAIDRLQKRIAELRVQAEAKAAAANAPAATPEGAGTENQAKGQATTEKTAERTPVAKKPSPQTPRQ